ncbi:MAG TPA: lipoate--protein ligase family protein [Leptolyngbyaceae cyanobacterium]
MDLLVLTQHWRLIPLMEGTGKTHMAVDRWLLHQHQQGYLPPALRFYTWSPPAISLGYHQRRWPEAWTNLAWQGEKVDLVRRPSGGRAVLHQGDLTYALITSGIAGNRLQAYQRVCQFLIDGFQALGIPLGFGDAGRSYRDNPNCFGTATGADLVLLENLAYKVIGSAQLWSEGCLLQHGSIRLQPDWDLHQQVFGQPEVPAQLPEPLASLAKEQSHKRITETLTSAAEACFNACFEVKPLAHWEVEQALEMFPPAI